MVLTKDVLRFILFPPPLKKKTVLKVTFIRKYFLGPALISVVSKRTIGYDGSLLLRWHAVAQWLWHCATNLKVAGSIPGGAIGVFH
jgi:hypothetical protein